MEKHEKGRIQASGCSTKKSSGSRIPRCAGESLIVFSCMALEQGLS